MVYRKFSNSRPLSKVKVGITADVVLGSPKKNCEGVGICRIERSKFPLLKNKTSRSCCRAKALIVEDKGELLFYFVRHTLPQCVLDKQFVGGVFKVRERAIIPCDIALELGFPPNTTIEAGNYGVVDLGVHLCVAIKVSNDARLGAVMN